MTERLIVISPHLDDAIWSVGSFLQTAEAAVIVTVCAGVPEGNMLVRRRRQEDKRACDRLCVEAHHLNVLDGKYVTDHSDRQAEVRRALIAALRKLVEKGDRVIAPLGIRHPDHELTATACQTMSVFLAGVYLELPYAHEYPEYIPAALRRWNEAGWKVGKRWENNIGASKAAAVAAYESQSYHGPTPQSLAGAAIFDLEPS